MNAPHAAEAAAVQQAAEQHATPFDAAAAWSAVARAQALVEFDLQGTILAANENFLQSVGYPLDELLGRSHRLLCDDAFARSEAYQRFWQKLGRGEADTGEYPHLAKNGREVWLQATYSPVLDNAGRPCKVVMLATDVTVNKLLTAELRGKLDALERSVAIAEFNLAGNVIAANDRFLSLLGYGLREVVGQHHGMLCPSAYVTSRAYADLWSKLGRGESDTGRHAAKAKHGHEVWLQTTYSPVLGTDGKPTKVVLFATDVTAAVEQELRQRERFAALTAPLARLLASIGDIATVSRDAGAAVQGSLTEAEVGSRTLAQSIDAIAQIEKSSDEMGEIVRLIGDIASQTHLLAFTAALESVRAGQHAPGFTGVAEELRKLAERSSLAASQSSRLIIESVKRVAPCTEASKQATGAFRRIADDIETTSRSLAALDQAASGQQQLAEQVATLLRELGLAPAHAPAESARG
ncbi:PAS domain-containing methyl-accepting chemotaxis protein [Caldimonas brevitalea]|uniref:Methyl-accepting chemotaxis protein n=1 Tax=Caldimonas brevitalea TaxID=413882 RepID=A0A0G3BDG8_9BURK|nr:PAS domain-containing methyl-accepting chemotaxis protein [Caldimonas brevitalea]AKJ27434.1 methyl-accepting chemotaxis protein [Caldimonas brevitalea]